LIGGTVFSIILDVLKIVGGIFGNFTSEETAVVQAQATVEGTAIESSASVQVKWWFIPFMAMVFFALPAGIWTWKAEVWDKVIMNGATSTDPLTGPLAWAYPVIVGGLFLHAMVLSK
jgi:hypothetical protein